MATPLDALRILPLGSAIAWWAIGTVPVARGRFGSGFERALTTVSFLIGAWAFVDWIEFGLLAVAPAGGATLLPNVRLTVITLATLAFLLAMKWISRGRSRSDGLLILPVLASLGLVWIGPDLAPADPVRYAVWVVPPLVYVGASIGFSFRLYEERKDLSNSVRRRFFWTIGGLVVVLATWLSTAVYESFTQPAGEPWFSAFLLIPAAIILIAIVPLTSEDFGKLLREVSAIQERVTAIYMFYRTGEPLVALASNRNLPIEAEQLEAILSVVGNFVETSVPSSRGYAVTAMRYEGLGLVAVRGEFVIVAAVYDGPVYDTLRSELTRSLKVFEERNWRDLGSWESATKVAEAGAEELSNLLNRPRRTTPPSLPTVSATEAKPRKTS